MNKRLVLAAAIALYGWASIWEGGTATTMAAEVTTSEAKTITLFENTTLRDETGKAIGIIAPQRVSILETSQRRIGHGEGYSVPIYLISTWAGKAWIMPENALVGEQKPVESNLELFGVESLYSDPGLTKPTGIQLAPQMVKVKAKWDNRYLIETINGERWIAPRQQFLSGVREVQQEILLKSTTKLFRYPYSLETGSAISPQKVKVNAVWRNWYRTDSWLGTVWFKLHELEASDEQNQVEVDFSYRYFDPTSRKTAINVMTQLGPSWSGHKESIPVEFSVWFYNELGQRIGISDGATTSLIYGEQTNIRLSVDNDITKYAYATIHIGMLSGQTHNDLNTSDPMELADPSQPALRLGAIHIRQDGEYSVIQGQFQLDKKGQNRVKGSLAFLDSNGKVLGKAPLDLATDTSFPGKGTMRAFEAVLSEDITGYTDVKLQVTSVEQGDEIILTPFQEEHALVDKIDARKVKYPLTDKTIRVASDISLVQRDQGMISIPLQKRPYTDSTFFEIGYSLYGAATKIQGEFFVTSLINADAQFQVIDSNKGTVLFQSPKLNSGDKPLAFNVDTTDVKELTMKVYSLSEPEAQVNAVFRNLVVEANASIPESMFDITQPIHVPFRSAENGG